MKWVTHWEALLFPDIKGLMVSVSFSFPLFRPPADALMGTGEQNTVFRLKGLCLHDLNLGLFTVLLLSCTRRQDKEILWICLWVQSPHAGFAFSHCILMLDCLQKCSKEPNSVLYKFFGALLLLLLQFSPMIAVLTSEPFKWQKWIQFCAKRSTSPSLCLELASCRE